MVELGSLPRNAGLPKKFENIAIFFLCRELLFRFYWPFRIAAQSGAPQFGDRRSDQNGLSANVRGAEEVDSISNKSAPRGDIGGV